MHLNIGRILSSLLIIYMYWIRNSTPYLSEECNPYESCKHGDPGDYVTDPEDCHNYYICFEDSSGDILPSDTPFECDPGYYFNISYGECRYDSYPCENECINICLLECTDYAYERLADPDDCSKFYTCDPSHEIQLTYCPDNAPYFDGLKCSPYSFACCDTCTPYCEHMYTEIFDPFDCRSYYFCNEVGYPSEEDRFECAEGLYFDTTLGKCILETDPNGCSPICTNSTTFYTTTNVPSQTTDTTANYTT